MLAIGMAACAPPVVQGGSNANDRSDGGEQGERLLTGAMVVSPDGRYVIAQRNQSTVLIDVERHRARELPEQIDRFLFAPGASGGVAVLADRATLVGYDLAEASEAWKVNPPLGRRA